MTHQSTPALPDLPTITRSQIEAALQAAWLDGDTFDGYADLDFPDTVLSVASALRDADLFGPYLVDVCFDWHEASAPEVGQVLVTVPGGITLCSYSSDVKNMTDDRAATGLDGLVAIATSIIGDARNHLAAARAWVAAFPR